MHVALLSGGKDSYYAVCRSGLNIDLGLVIRYEFPRPSPHTLNLGKTIETLLLSGIPITVARLSKGKELEETVRILRKLRADTIIAGDVHIEDHLKYMEKVAKEAGATLVEPLWGLDPLEALYEEVGVGIKPLIIGCGEGLDGWLGTILGGDSIDEFVYEARRLGIDPLGEHGEYHTIVVDGPLHASPLRFKILGTEDYGNYKVLRLV